MAEGDAQDDSQKTEEPTPKKLEESRKKGQVALSREVNNWVMLLAATILIATASKPLFLHLKDHLRGYIAHAHDLPGMPGGFALVLGRSFWDVLGMIILPLLVLMAAAFLGPFLQVGPLFAPEVLKPDLSKISPLKGFQRLFSARSLMEFVKGILKLGVVAVVGVVMLYPFYERVEHFIGLPLIVLLHEMLALTVRMMAGILIVLMVIAVIDLVYQRMEHYKKMRMTRQELKDEYKQTEGDPQIRAKLRALRQEKARQRMMQAVPEADVVITNPTHYAIALKYKPEEMDAPLCVAKGADAVALRIREVAKAHKVIIYEAPPLARALYDAVEIDEIIPPAHYKAVAEVISFVFRTRGRL
ncbi:MAG: flagellar biosynthesis protein FlhB [Alphaproteobacteria bacterium]|nr:flagellar biosynthesis protein FlhB [Alphaproteobacteria bacterium]